MCLPYDLFIFVEEKFANRPFDVFEVLPDFGHSGFSSGPQCDQLVDAVQRPPPPYHRSGKHDTGAYGHGCSQRVIGAKHPHKEYSSQGRDWNHCRGPEPYSNFFDGALTKFFEVVSHTRIY